MSERGKEKNRNITTFIIRLKIRSIYSAEIRSIHCKFVFISVEAFNLIDFSMLNPRAPFVDNYGPIKAIFLVNKLKNCI